MKLPPPSVRAGLKLEDASQRLVWAISCYVANLQPYPGSRGNIGGTIPPSKKKEGIEDEYPWFHWWWGSSVEPRSYATSLTASIPYDASRYARGYSLRDCLIEFSTEEVEVLIPSVVPNSGSPIPDNSTATSLEQYIYDNYLEFHQDRIANPVTLPPGQTFTYMGLYRSGVEWNSLGKNDISPTSKPISRKNAFFEPTLIIDAQVLRKPNRQRQNSLIGITDLVVENRFSPYDFCSYSRYNLLSNQSGGD